MLGDIVCLWLGHITGWGDAGPASVTVQEQLTDLGRTLVKFPLLPRFGAMLVKAQELGVLQHTIAVVAGMSAQVGCLYVCCHMYGAFAHASPLEATTCTLFTFDWM